MKFFYLRHKMLQMMAANPPFNKTEDNNLNSDELVERLWKLMKYDIGIFTWNTGVCISRNICEVTSRFHGILFMFNFSATFAHDSRLRCDIADLYYSLYGRSRPSCLPIPEVTPVNLLKGSADVFEWKTNTINNIKNHFRSIDVEKLSPRKWMWPLKTLNKRWFPNCMMILNQRSA